MRLDSPSILGGYKAENGNGVRTETRTETAQALESGQLGVGEYYAETGANLVTFGVYDQGKATYQYANGQIDTNEYSTRMGTAGVFQLGAAYGLRNTQIGNLSLREVPGQLVRNVVEGGKALLTDDRGMIPTDGTPLPTRPEPPVPQTDPRINSNPRTFRGWVKSLQTQAAQTPANQLAGRLSEAQTRALLDNLRQRGWSIPRGVETDWMGGPHINVFGPGGGPNIHLPVPPGFVP